MARSSFELGLRLTCEQVRIAQMIRGRSDGESGITRQNLHLWRTHGLRGLPARTTLDGMAAELRLPYVRVLEAALRDAAYLGAAGLVATIVQDA